MDINPKFTALNIIIDNELRKAEGRLENLFIHITNELVAGLQRALSVSNVGGWNRQEIMKLFADATSSGSSLSYHLNQHPEAKKYIKETVHKNIASRLQELIDKGVIDNGHPELD